MNQKYINKIKRKLIQNGFLKTEPTLNNETRFFIYEYAPKLKSKYRLINTFIGDWEFQREVIFLNRGECWERFKIIKLYPNLKQYFFSDIKKFCKYFKIEITKKQCERNPYEWDRYNMLTGERTYGIKQRGVAVSIEDKHTPLLSLV